MRCGLNSMTAIGLVFSLTAPPVLAAPMDDLLPSVLSSLVDEVKGKHRAREEPIVVFDLDGTLLDNRERTLRIMKLYAEREVAPLRPKVAERIASLRLEDIGSRVMDTLARVGVSDPAIVNNAVVFWGERFFTGKYAGFDVAKPGSAALVRTLHGAGARIVYWSTRDASTHLAGTIEVLQRQGFPVGVQGTEVILKPNKQMMSSVFKRRAIAYLQQTGTVVGAFDDEAVNSNLCRRAFSKASCVWVNLDGARPKSPLLDEVTELRSYEPQLRRASVRGTPGATHSSSLEAGLGGEMNPLPQEAAAVAGEG